MELPEWKSYHHLSSLPKRSLDKKSLASTINGLDPVRAETVYALILYHHLSNGGDESKIPTGCSRNALGIKVDLNSISDDLLQIIGNYLLQ